MLLKPMIRLLMVMVMVATHAIADDSDFCPEAKSQGEGHWPVPEQSFNQTSAEEAMQSLQQSIETGSTAADLVGYENDLMMIKGFLLKKYAISDPSYRVEFCEFIQHEAYIKH